MPATKDYEKLSSAVAKMITYNADNYLSVSANIDKIYAYAPLEEYSFWHRITIRLIAFFSYVFLRIVGRTLRFEVEGQENFDRIIESGHQPIYCFWHDRILAGTYYFRDRGIAVMTSRSKDGEYIARFIQKLGYGAVRGSSSRGGTGALVEMIRLMRAGAPTAFTVDGPRGPRYEAKSGPVYLAKKSGHPMMPFIVECRRYWKVGSWDRLQIPKPFGRVNVIIDPPIYVDAESTDDELEQKRAELQHSLERLVERGRKWRNESS